MKYLIFLALAAYWVSQVSCFNFGDCFLDFPDETAQTDILELVASTNYDNFYVVRKTKLDRGDSITPFDGDLHSFNYSIDNKFATFYSYQIPSGSQVIRYGPSLDDYSAELGPIKTIEGAISPDGNSYSLIERGSLTYTLSHLNDTESYITDYKLLVKNLYDINVDTVEIAAKPFFTDSMSIQSIYLEDIQYDIDGSKIAISATLDSDIEWTKILWSSAYFSIPKKINDPSLIRINSSNEIDTLYSFPLPTDSLSGTTSFFFGYMFNYSYEVTRHGIFIKKDAAVYRLNEQEKKLSDALYDGDLPEQLSPNGKFALTRYELVNFETGEVFNLEDTFSDYYQGFISNSKIVFIGSKRQSIAIFDLESFELEKEISISEIPKFNELENVDYSEEYLTEPIINQKNELVFMRVRHANLRDPNYDCYD